MCVASFLSFQFNGSDMKYQTARDVIPSSERMQREIIASHKRSQQYGINREKRDKNQVRLSPAEFDAKVEKNKEILTVVIPSISDFYELLSPEEFMVAYVSGDGYILHVAGSEKVKSAFAKRQGLPGYRWKEEDVGATAISICLKRKIPIQLNAQDYYCRQAHGSCSCAAPVFGKQDNLDGVLVVVGLNSVFHPNTLVMITMAARSIEKHMRLLRRNHEKLLYTGFLDSVIESAETGILTLDREMRILKINKKGNQILKQRGLDGKQNSIIESLSLNLEDIQLNPKNWKEREVSLQIDKQDVHLYYSARPVVSEKNELLGAVLFFNEFKDIKKLANKVSGTKAIFTFDLLVGSSKSFRKSIDLAIRASQSSSTVLLLGETGTGKELFAQAIHNGSKRREQAFIPINCGAIPSELLESELFGYVGGAFTGASKNGRPGKFELADGGTILLDEIGDMQHDMQVKLLRVLQTGEVQRIGANKVSRIDARIIAATHVDLQKAIKHNRFRTDLFYRLNIIEITLPPLRERGPEDIEALALHFIKRFSPGTSLSSDALEKLVNYSWPGNVRELENTIERGLHLCDSGKLQATHIDLQVKSTVPNKGTSGTLREMEQELINTTINACHGNMAQSAKILGVSRTTLYRKVKEFGIETV